jgi:hypothetical protein
MKSGYADSTRILEQGVIPKWKFCLKTGAKRVVQRGACRQFLTSFRVGTQTLDGRLTLVAGA